MSVTYDDEPYSWYIATDEYNKTYIHCRKSRATAYMENDGTMLYFTDFEGKKIVTALSFYRSCFKLLLSNEREIPVSDNIPLTKEHPKGTRWFQDLLAPFVIFTQICYRSVLIETDNIHYPEKMVYRSLLETKSFNIKLHRRISVITVNHHQIKINTKITHYVSTGYNIHLDIYIVDATTHCTTTTRNSQYRQYNISAIPAKGLSEAD